jgi:hypothetical protein
VSDNPKRDRSNEPKRDTHPSYGTVLFTRTYGGGGKERLFGSSILKHFSTIKLSIHEAERYHDLHQDHVWGGIRQIIEVEMSAAQFAELLTTMNVGTGVPCTIRWREGVGRVEDPPDDEIEIDRVQHSFRENLDGLVTWLLKRRKDMMAIFKKKAIGKHDREEIVWIVERVIQEVRSNLPFTVDQFNEAAERIVTAAKAEVDSFVTQTIQVTGIEQLRAMKGGEVIAPKALPYGVEGDDQE